ncbi:hypothetical protein ACFX2A_046037 [Malus domestica]
MATSASPLSESVSPTVPSNPNSFVSSSITIQNIGSMVPIKLTTTNYLMWSALFAPIFCQYNLIGLIDGSMAAPPQFTFDSSGNRILNLAYVSWYENDQNILIWINSTLSKSLILYIIGQIETIVDALASAGFPVEDSDLILVTLHSLPPEYDSFVDAIQFHLGSTTIDELYSLLISKEIQLANCKKSGSDLSPFQALQTYAGILPLPASNPNSQAFVAQSSTFTNQGHRLDRNHNCGNSRFFNNQRSSNFNHYNNTNQRFNHGGRTTFSYNKKNFCQICHQFDHEACDFPHRMNPAYGGKSSHSAMVANTSSYLPTWIVDSGATSHMTNSYATL